MTRLRKAVPFGGCSFEKKRSDNVTRKDVHLHKRALEDLVDGTVLKYRVKGKTLLVGYKQGSRICCDCCNTEFSASKFEAHANRAAHKKPYGNIYTPEGVSLHELAMKSDKDREHSQKSGDGLCCLCSNGGSDLRCSDCRKSFHKKCASVTDFPMWRWYCRDCRRKINREKFAKHDPATAIAKQSTTSPIHTVYNLPSQWSSCFLCSRNDFLESGFGPRTIIFCDQCEKEYHIDCLEHHKMANLQEMPSGEWFCSMSCKRIHCDLQTLVEHGDIKLTASLLELIRTKSPNIATDSDLKCRLFRGKIDSFEAATMLTQALAIFHDSFGSLTVGDSGFDLFEAMLFWGLKDDTDPEYHGMFCVVLCINSKVISSAILRVFDPKVAEIPFIATRRNNWGKGYLKTLLAVIEDLLASLKVEMIVLPSTEEARSMWTNRFGFTVMTAEQVRELKRVYFSMVQLPGTTMLSKSISKVPVT